MTKWEVLGLTSEATKGEVKQAYRKLAKASHPDRKGGDADRFDRLNKAYKWCLERAIDTTVCTTCDGDGYIIKMHGFKAYKVDCPDC